MQVLAAAAAAARPMEKSNSQCHWDSLMQFALKVKMATVCITVEEFAHLKLRCCRQVSRYDNSRILIDVVGWWWVSDEHGIRWRL